MVSPRRLSLLGAGVVMIAWIGVTAGIRAHTDAEIRLRAEAVDRALDSTILHADDATRAIVLSYRERARLGLGSPFRLIDQSVHDPRLSDSIGRAVGGAIARRLLRHETYEIDAGVFGASDVAGKHLRVINQTIVGARDPRVGELCVRLAYAIAGAEGAVSSSVSATAIEAASQVRDRVVAESDLRRMIERSGDDRLDLIDEILLARRDRLLEVERPILARETTWSPAEISALRRKIERLERDSAAIAVGSRSLLHVALAPTIARAGARLPPP